MTNYFISSLEENSNLPPFSLGRKRQFSEMMKTSPILAINYKDIPIQGEVSNNPFLENKILKKDFSIFTPKIRKINYSNKLDYESSLCLEKDFLNLKLNKNESEIFTNPQNNIFFQNNYKNDKNIYLENNENKYSNNSPTEKDANTFDFEIEENSQKFSENKTYNEKNINFLSYIDTNFPKNLQKLKENKNNIQSSNKNLSCKNNCSTKENQKHLQYNINIDIEITDFKDETNNFFTNSNFCDCETINTSGNSNFCDLSFSFLTEYTNTNVCGNIISNAIGSEKLMMKLFDVCNPALQPNEKNVIILYSDMQKLKHRIREIFYKFKNANYNFSPMDLDFFYLMNNNSAFSQIYSNLVNNLTNEDELMIDCSIDCDNIDDKYDFSMIID